MVGAAQGVLDVAENRVYPLKLGALDSGFSAAHHHRLMNAARRGDAMKAGQPIGDDPSACTEVELRPGGDFGTKSSLDSRVIRKPYEIGSMSASGTLRPGGCYVTEDGAPHDVSFSIGCDIDGVREAVSRALISWGGKLLEGGIVDAAHGGGESPLGLEGAQSRPGARTHASVDWARMAFNLHQPTVRESSHISVLMPPSGWGRWSVFASRCPLRGSPCQGPVYPPVGRRARIGLSCRGRPHITFQRRSRACAAASAARTSSRSASTAAPALRLLARTTAGTARPRPCNAYPICTVSCRFGRRSTPFSSGAIVKFGVRRVGHAAALLSSMSSIPSLNLTPLMTFARWRTPRSRRQDFSAHRPIL